MPYQVIKKGEKWFVENETTKRIIAAHATKAKAEAQMRLLYMVEGQKHGE